MDQQKKIADHISYLPGIFCVPLNSTFIELKEKLYGPFFPVSFMFKDQSISGSYHQAIYRGVIKGGARKAIVPPPTMC